MGNGGGLGNLGGEGAVSKLGSEMEVVGAIRSVIILVLSRGLTVIWSRD